jgi:predicted CoA-binding protein
LWGDVSGAITTQADIDEFLKQKRFAFVGVSRQARDFSRALFREFRNKGYEPVPVHPQAVEIEGARCFARVQDIQPPVDAALLMTPASVSGTVAADCVAAGLSLVWFYQAAGSGASSGSAIDQCLASGLRVIPGECPMMFLPGTGAIHRFHGWIRKIAGTYPD